MADFKGINTQEELDAIIKERLGRSEQKVRDEFKGWTSPDDLKALNDAHAKAIEDLKATHAKELEKYAGYDEKFKTQDKEIHDLKVGSMKVKIANDKKLPYDAVEFLQGEDEKSITESADRLAKLSNQPRSFSYTRSTEDPDNTADTMWRTLASSLPGKNN